ncbi:hypothetical protein HYN48_13925 [Flavobacterium magnum]|uniref:Uncharacterized protein n=2 Tax=Flavobacterium magnum TaxID=2162713 RepID=A0A2S0RGN2_9FLAO|nr:hypothetical protein HYN48_13925 [Flavobacterium magnum]
MSISFYVSSCNRKAAEKNSNANLQDTIKPRVHTTKENTFPELRQLAFSVTPEKLGLTLPNDQVSVYGVIMDWEMDGAIATTISYVTGDASLYLSSGGGVIGGGQHENVNIASKQFTNLAKTFLDQATKTTQTSLPGKNEVQFFLLTNKGMYVGKDIMPNFENNSSKWMKLFEEGNKLLSELRRTSGG